jgi:hypothetical protein
MDEKIIGRSNVRSPGRPPTDRKTRSFTVVLDVSDWGEIERIANSWNSSKGEVIRRAICVYLKDLAK